MTAFAICFVCAIIDYRTTKIPNLITFPATAVALMLRYMDTGWAGVIDGLIGALVGVGLTVAPKFKKEESIGFGDAKLMMALGAFLGWAGELLVIFYFWIIWGLIAVYRFLSVLPLKHLFGALLAKKSGGSWFTPDELRKIQAKMQTPIPLAPAIFVGLLLAVFLYHGTLKFMGFE